MGFQTTKDGEFWRILLPGIYSVEVRYSSIFAKSGLRQVSTLLFVFKVFAEGFQPREVQFAVIEQNPTLLNITLIADHTRR